MSDPSDSFATPRVAAGALFVDEHGRVLLVHPTYKDGWEVPGGYAERGESPAAACKRELQEELGLSRDPVDLLAVDWAPAQGEGDKLLFLFDCGPLGPDAHIRVDDREIDDFRWVELGDLGTYVVERLARRVVSALTEQCTYLENGRATLRQDAR